MTEQNTAANIMDTARALADENKTTEAVEAYTAALQQLLGADPEAELEAALYILQFGEDYKLPYTCLYYLYQRGFARADILAIMEQAFYAPNVKLLKKRYEKNCKLLAKYPYLFRRDFLPFEDLPRCFFPYEDGSYYPFDLTTGEFLPLFTPKDPVISRNFFKDLTNPILADDVFSQYELEYLYDNVRKSEWVARENHIYLHYTNWALFCAYLQVLDLRPILDDKKIVFLIGDEIAKYPIDFKAEYGIDYTQYPLKPVGIKEINRLIWHVQHSSHNGGDFFNEVFDQHPNLLLFSSLFLDEIIGGVRNNLEQAKIAQENKGVFRFRTSADVTMYQRLDEMKAWTEKDMLVAMFLNVSEVVSSLDQSSRIAPAVFVQPHFPTLREIPIHCNGNEIMLSSEDRDALLETQMFQGFKYIKTFIPLRRPTNSYAASIRFTRNHIEKNIRQVNENFSETRKLSIVGLDNAVEVKALTRTHMADPDIRAMHDSVVVRFEDGKLNPKATFSALAAFLDIPYTESMTYCSFYGERDPEQLKGNTRGFDSSIVYRTYEDYANDAERFFIEYCLRDAYTFYGYDFHYYDGQPLTEDSAQKLTNNFSTFKKHYQAIAAENIRLTGQMELSEEQSRALQMSNDDGFIQYKMQDYNERNMSVYRILSKDITFVNKDRKLLRMIPLLKLDPELLETELYH